MTQETGDPAVDRLYALLVDALQQSRGDFTAPVTVAEIYQELVPYRTVRAEAGFGMNADYEHALLRLLAGEAGRVRLEPATARDTILRELSGANPNVGLYRDYAACDVWVAPPAATAAIRAAAPADAAAAADATLAALSDVLDDDDDFIFALVDEVADDDEVEEPRAVVSPDAEAEAIAGPDPDDVERELAELAGADLEAAAAHESVQRGLEPGRCTYCDSPLPTQRPVRFCPYCGGDQTTRPCDACGEPLEPGWMFCVSCGQARDSVQ